MKKLFLVAIIIIIYWGSIVSGQSKIDSLMPIRGFCIGAPKSKELDAFIKFVNDELIPRQVNTLVLRVDFNYQFKSYPELRDEDALSKHDVNAIVKACRKGNIRIIPQINFLGHQSWANRTNNLLKAYPDFDETPHIKMPEKYEWPNADGLYCKSYCPLHPEVHKVVFALMDEICDVYESEAFHAGMDEVFYIGNDKCPRCSGRDKAELFAGEVNEIRDHLALNNRKLWIWGDRLIDGKTTGIGMWEASMNSTHRAIDMISKDVVICDWHYERPDQTAVWFAMKGFNVISCPWRKPAVGIAQAQDMVRFRKSATSKMKDRFQGVMQTVWSGAGPFLDEFYGIKVNPETGENTPSNCFRAMFEEIKRISESK